MQDSTNEILDEDLEKDGESRKDMIAFIMSLIMLFGGAFFLKNTTNLGADAAWKQLLAASVIFQFVCVFIGVLLTWLTLSLSKQEKYKFISVDFLQDSTIKGFILWLGIVLIVISDKVLL